MVIKNWAMMPMSATAIKQPDGSWIVNTAWSQPIHNYGKPMYFELTNVLSSTGYRGSYTVSAKYITQDNVALTQVMSVNLVATRLRLL